MDLELNDNASSQQFRSRVILGQPERPKMLDFILKTGLVKSEKTAVTILMTLTVLIFGVSIYIFMHAGASKASVPPRVSYPDGTMSPYMSNQ